MQKHACMFLFPRRTSHARSAMTCKEGGCNPPLNFYKETILAWYNEQKILLFSIHDVLLEENYLKH